MAFLEHPRYERAASASSDETLVSARSARTPGRERLRKVRLNSDAAVRSRGTSLAGCGAGSWSISARVRSPAPQSAGGQGTQDMLRREAHSVGAGLGFRMVSMDTAWWDITEAMAMIELDAQSRQQPKNSSGPYDWSRDRFMSTDVDANELKMHGIATVAEQKGLTVDDVSRSVYHVFEDRRDILKPIGFNNDGGIAMIGSEWPTTEELDLKRFWFWWIVISVLFNFFYLLEMDWSIFYAFVADFIGRTKHKPWSLSFTWVSPGTAEQSKEAVVENYADIFEHLVATDEQTRVTLLNIAALAATFEMIWILKLVLDSAYLWWTFCRQDSEYKSFRAVIFFFQKLLPQFSTFSAIKLMVKVHPSLIYGEYLHHVASSRWRTSRAGYAATTSFFFLKILICAAIALSAFTIKTLAVGLRFINPAHSLIYRIGSAIALIAQCMGCVILEVVLQDRLFLFVFGGPHATYADDNQAYKNVYEARIAKQIWEHFWIQRKQKMQAIVLLATFDHYDMQRLLVKDWDIWSEQSPEPEDDTPSVIESPASELSREGTSNTLTHMPFFFDARLSVISEADEEDRRLKNEATNSGLLKSTLSGASASIPMTGRKSVDSTDDGVREGEEHLSRSHSSSSLSSVGMRALTRYLVQKDGGIDWTDVGV